MTEKHIATACLSTVRPDGEDSLVRPPEVLKGRRTWGAGGVTKTQIRVNYCVDDGYHILWSKDVDGLFVAARNKEDARRDLIEAIAFLFAHNHGLSAEVDVTPMSLGEGDFDLVINALAADHTNSGAGGNHL